MVSTLTLVGGMLFFWLLDWWLLLQLWLHE